MIESWCKEEVVSLAFNIMNSMSTVFITLLCLFLEATLVLISQWKRRYWISSWMKQSQTMMTIVRKKVKGQSFQTFLLRK